MEERGNSLSPCSSLVERNVVLKFYKVVLVIEEEQISRLNAILRYDHIRNWLDAWSIKSFYELYTNGQIFFELYDKLREAKYRERKELNLI
jgi:hypothetical protein